MNITNSKETNNDLKRILPGLVVSAICLAAIFYLVDIQFVISAIRQADYRLVSLSILVQLLWLVVRTKVWKTLLQDQATYSQVFNTVNEGYLLNNILPFRLGEIGRAFLMSQKAGLSFWEVLSTILIERALDVMMAVGLVFSALSLAVGASWTFEAALGVAIMVAGGLLFLYFLARNRDWVLSKFESATSRQPVLEKIGNSQLPLFISGLAVLTNLHLFIRTLFWIGLNWGIAVLEFYILLLAFVPYAELNWAAFALGVTALGIAVPSSPGAVGVFELAKVAALSLFGIDPSVSLAFALTAHFILYITTGILGVFALARDGETLTGLYNRIRRIPQENTS